MKIMKEFREFVMRGNVLDLAIGIVIGMAFTAIVTSVVNDIIMPSLGYLVRGIDFADLFLVLREGSTPGPYLSLAEARDVSAVTINYGLFINAVVSFLIIASVLFLIIKTINRLKKAETPPPPNTMECPYCLESVPINAARCRFCTSYLNQKKTSDLVP